MTTRIRRQGVISLANEEVSIVGLLRRLGVQVPEIADDKSWKTHCPFSAQFHSDRGAEKALRVYASTNTAYCFYTSCVGYLDPVRLAALSYDLPPREAAQRILDEAGVRAPAANVDDWRKLLERPEAPLDRSSLAEALRVYAQATRPDWSAGASAQFERCVQLLPYVHSSSDAVEWLRVAKVAMQHALTGESQ